MSAAALMVTLFLVVLWLLLVLGSFYDLVS